VYFGSTDTKVYALDMAAGAQQWLFIPGSTRSPPSQIESGFALNVGDHPSKNAVYFGSNVTLFSVGISGN
jgi:hypothetical protein